MSQEISKQFNDINGIALTKKGSNLVVIQIKPICIVLQ